MMWAAALSMVMLVQGSGDPPRKKSDKASDVECVKTQARLRVADEADRPVRCELRLYPGDGEALAFYPGQDWIPVPCCNPADRIVADAEDPEFEDGGPYRCFDLLARPENVLTLKKTLYVAAFPGLAETAGNGAQILFEPVTCFVAGEFPLLDAGIEPAPAGVTSVARARLYFRGPGSSFYYVEMAERGGRYYGKLPRPRVEAERITYYVQATTTDFQESMTRPIEAVVVKNVAECGTLRVATRGPSGDVTVFSASGPTAAAGYATGSSRGALAWVFLGGAAAAASAGIVISQADDDMDYILSGDPTLAGPIVINDFLRVRIEGRVLGEFGSNGQAAPISFKAKAGDVLTIEALDAGDTYRLGPLFVARPGKVGQEVTGGVPECSVPARPCPTPAGPPATFFSVTSRLP